MFNFLTLSSIKSIFFKNFFEIIIIIIYVYILINFFKSKNIIIFFINILYIVVYYTFFLFFFNINAFGGFLILCETSSLFFLFIILNKNFSDFYKNIFFNKNKNKYIYLYLFFVIYFFILNTKYSYNFLIKFNFFENDYFLINDFKGLFYVLYSNYLNFLLLFCFFIIIFTFFIISYFHTFNDSFLKKKNKKIFNFFKIFKKIKIKKNIFINKF